MVEKTTDTSLWPSLWDPFRAFGTRLADWLSPAADAKSDGDAYRITMELPGVAEDDIHVTAEGGMLMVKGEKKSDREEKGEGWFFSERQYGSFQRSFRLPADADESAVTAALKDGVLTITVPKKPQAAAKSTRIPVAKG